MVALPLILVPMGEPNTHEFVVRSRRAKHNTVLDLESATSGSATGTVDRSRWVLFLQHCDGAARMSGTGCGEEADGGGTDLGG
jgi:hypothetical protein